MLWHWHSNLAYYFRNNWLNKLHTILWYYWYKLKRYYPTSDTTTLMIWYSWHHQLYYHTWLDTTILFIILDTKQIYLYDDTWYNNLYITILATAISPINIQQRFSQLSYALTILLIQNPNNLSPTTDITTLQCYITWYHTRYAIWIQMPIATLSMNKATARPLLEDPHRCAYQERLGGRHATTQDYEFRVIILYCFFPVLPFVLLDIRLSEDQ
jgi:hypothetical protein